MSLIHGWLLPTVLWVAIPVLVGALARRRNRRWLIELVVVAGAATLTVWALAVVFVDGSKVLDPAPPLKVYAWLAASVFVLYAVALGWRSASRRQRMLGVPAVLLAVFLAAGQVNRYYGYYPTLDALLGRRFAHEVTLRDLRASGYLGHAYRYRHGVPVAHRVTGGGTAAVLSRPVAHEATAREHLVARHNVPRGTAPSDAGRLVSVPIPGPMSGFRARNAWVYLPPVWFGTHRPRLPVIVLLNGTPGSPIEWFRNAQAHQFADAYARAHGGWSPILVAVDENGGFVKDTECVDRPGARADTYVSVDVPAFVQRTFDTATSPGQWALEGLSEGGTCALTVALRHPDRFGAFVDLAGEARPSVGSDDLVALYGGSTAKARTYDPASLFGARRYPNLGAWFEVGRQDGRYVRVNRSLYEQAVASGADARLVEPSGAHTFWVFRAGFRDSWGWLVARFDAHRPARPMSSPHVTTDVRPVAGVRSAGRRAGRS